MATVYQANGETVAASELWKGHEMNASETAEVSEYRQWARDASDETILANINRDVARIELLADLRSEPVYRVFVDDDSLVSIVGIDMEVGA